MHERPLRGWGRRFAALAGAIALVGGIPLASPAGGAPAACPTAVPLASVKAGMAGTGYTVSRGTKPEPFDVEVLGVLRNPYMPMRNMIIVEATSPDIDRSGIWSGMSGSPVYVGGRLLGAVAFRLAYGPSKIAGLTVGGDMLELTNRPTASPTAGFPTQVKMTDAMRARIARATGTTQANVGGSMVQLRIPLSVSGLTARGMRGLKHFLAQNNVRAIPFSGASVAASETADAAQLEPGSNFAAALSYGDITYAAIGTLTFVCNGKAVAFGHPFFWEGKTALGANVADAITVVEDPIFGPYKLAEVGGSVGTVDQDRFAGIRAVLNGGPRTIPVTSTTASVDSGRTHQGQTRVVFGQDVVHVALDHLFVAILATQDQFGEGSSRMSWTLRGTKESGGTWNLTRSNMYTSRWGIAYETVEELHWQLHRLEDNKFDPVEFTGVHANVSVREDVRQYAIADVKASVGGGPYRAVRALRVRAGQHIGLRVTLEPYQGTTKRVVTLGVRVPRGVRGRGGLEIAGGEACLYRCRHPGVQSFTGFLRAEENQDHNNDLVAAIYAGAKRPPAEVAKAKRVLDRVVTRRKLIRLVIVR
jgi:hypothetical protein